MKSIKLKLVLLYIILVFIVMTVSGTYMRIQIRNEEVSKATDDLKEFAKHIREQIIEVYPSPGDYNMGFTNLFASNANRLQGNIIDSRWQTVGSSTRSLSESYRSNVVISAFNGSPASSYGRVTNNDITSQVKEWIEYAEPYFNENEEVEYVIYVRTDAKQINDNIAVITRVLVIMSVLSLVLTGVLGFMFATTLTGPIIVLTKKAKDMASGNLNQEITVSGKDEIGQLTESFNDMAKELNKTMASIEREKNKLEVIQHNMTDGVLAYDTDGVLLHANYSSQDLLGVQDIEKVMFSDMMKKLGIDEAKLYSQGLDNLTESTVLLGEKFIAALATPYLDKYNEIAGIVIVLQDITRHKKLDDMRKEFVANVSHELRTPLTTIKSYTETLLDGALEDRSITVDFLSTIESETDRMALLVKDLLELSSFDNKQLKLGLEPVDLNVLIEKSISQNTVMAEKKNQKILCKSLPKACMVEGDSGRINQVLINIISNSVKYSSEGGSIEVYTEETDKYYRLYIKDNGIGIPQEDLKHIFERFYRVDKARSRAMGGTGLGLAIAKEIMEAHGGKITAISEQGKGTTMILRFNKIHDL